MTKDFLTEIYPLGPILFYVALQKQDKPSQYLIRSLFFREIEIVFLVAIFQNLAVLRIILRDS